MFWLGIFLGVISSTVIAFLISEITDKNVAFIIIIIGVILGGYIGMQSDVVDYNKKIENWKNTKMVIENSMKNDNMTQLEKIDLVNNIVKYNTQLTELKKDVKHWWYFYLDDDKVNKLEIIKID